VSGATGFIGAHLIRALSEEHEITALARNAPPRHGPARIRWVFQDLAAPLDEARLPSQIDAVIHLAQSRFYKEFPEQARDILGVNVHGALELLEYSRRAHAQTFVLASSGGVYGYSFEKLMETAPVNPLDFYLSSKYAAELLTANYQRFFKTIVLRFFFVYGPGQSRMLIPTLLRKVTGRETILVEANPELHINPIYVGDAVRVFEPALRLGASALVNVAGDEVVSITELISVIERATGRTASITYKESTHTGDLIGDNSRMKTTLGISPQTALLAGVKQMI